MHVCMCVCVRWYAGMYNILFIYNIFNVRISLFSNVKKKGKSSPVQDRFPPTMFGPAVEVVHDVAAHAAVATSASFTCCWLSPAFLLALSALFDCTQSFYLEAMSSHVFRSGCRFLPAVFYCPVCLSPLCGWHANKLLVTRVCLRPCSMLCGPNPISFSVIESSNFLIIDNFYDYRVWVSES